jgi:transcriptional repressor NrdR
LRCPYCGDESHRVIDSRVARGTSEIRRRRECDECGRRFTTRERVEETLPKVIKRDERREEYDRSKLLHGLEAACVKRPVSADAIERLVERVEKRLQESGAAEVSSGEIGERLLEGLEAIDALAAVRFASVFRNFESTADYASFFQRLAGPEAARPALRAADADADAAKVPLRVVDDESGG